MELSYTQRNMLDMPNVQTTCRQPGPVSNTHTTRCQRGPCSIHTRLAVKESHAQITHHSLSKRAIFNEKKHVPLLNRTILETKTSCCQIGPCSLPTQLAIKQNHGQYKTKSPSNRAILNTKIESLPSYGMFNTNMSRCHKRESCFQHLKYHCKT